MATEQRTDRNGVVNLDEMIYFKGVLQSIQERIEKFEFKGVLKPKEQKELRMILMGPPGAGKFL